MRRKLSGEWEIEGNGEVVVMRKVVVVVEGGGPCLLVLNRNPSLRNLFSKKLLLWHVETTLRVIFNKTRVKPQLGGTYGGVVSEAERVE